jgi:hypothetical protein
MSLIKITMSSQEVLASLLISIPFQLWIWLLVPSLDPTANPRLLNGGFYMGKSSNEMVDISYISIYR